MLHTPMLLTLYNGQYDDNWEHGINDVDTFIPSEGLTSFRERYQNVCHHDNFTRGNHVATDTSFRNETN